MPIRIMLFENLVLSRYAHKNYASVGSVPHGSMVTQDYRQDRVRIFVDKKSNTVVKIPKIG